ncbi:Vms1/Ankzf1 family peptidyl-tRNA hydrolase [Geodermatophilus sp. DSM 44513]|uniref:baeRF2 domain-containing protein n=1 Tax=Geodermatophilus sp. DSM 44513 TaxID=1528104 RepID=UPI001282A1D1|nr:Vms1/Ankzf1 family peptidyl-tRNA hydrolase [Geodermatophilus sp. DSM 44513]WNV77227.1 Vms1/Ankzf1 family peptidyl-tRNA hydrolase [Geodermatophilus sp. DSM 44513]
MDVSFLAPVFTAPGPYATVCADVTHTTENADTELELRVRAVAEQLQEQGAPEPVVQAVRDRLLEGNDGGEAGTLQGRAVVVATDGSVVLDEVLADVPRDPVVEWSPQPALLPVLRQIAGRVPHVVVVADRVGADIYVASRAGRPEQQEQVEGNRSAVRRLGTGALSQSQHEQAAGRQWEENADEVAEEIASLARRLHPRFILLAGDVRARQVLTDRADKAWADLVVTLEEGGRAAGADREPVERRAAELVAEYEAHDEADVVEKISSAAAHGLAVTGTASVVEALRKSQVETLVLADRPDDEELVVGPDPLLLGTGQGDMQALGVQDAQSVPADRALVAAAVASDAGVVVVPRSAMPGDIPVAAILRYTDDSTPKAQ